MVGGGPFDLPAGAWTDDTSMAMCLAESILDTGGLDASDQLRRFVAWWRNGYWSSTDRCFDIDIAEAAERSAESSRTTHPAPRPVDACGVMGAMIAANSSTPISPAR